MNEIDTYYIHCISSLHSIDHLISGEPSSLQTHLEDALLAKTGSRKDLSALISAIKQPTEIYKNLTSTTIEEKTTSSSDNELELDLLKEDLMCIVCKGMDVGAKNRLLECSDCHSLYHQECHRPVVSSEETDSTWVCQNCKEIRHQKSSPVFGRSSHSISTSRESKSTYRQNSSSSQSYKSSSKSSSSSYKSSTEKLSSKSSSSNNGSRSTSSINADKRIQSMKKKALSKLQDQYKK